MFISNWKLQKWRINHMNWSGKEENFSKLTRKGDKWTILLCVGGKNWAADKNFRGKRASQFRSFKTALLSPDFIYRKLRQTSQAPPPPKKKKKSSPLGGGGGGSFPRSTLTTFYLGEPPGVAPTYICTVGRVIFSVWLKIFVTFKISVGWVSVQASWCSMCGTGGRYETSRHSSLLRQRQDWYHFVAFIHSLTIASLYSFLHADQTWVWKKQNEMKWKW